MKTIELKEDSKIILEHKNYKDNKNIKKIEIK